LGTKLASPASGFVKYFLPAFFLSITIFTPCAWPQQDANNSQTQASPFHLINSVSGSKEVTKNAQETITDPRTVFHVPEDNQVVVVFEMEGPTGAHHLEGQWRSPDGKVLSVGDVDMQTYTPKFFCYFSLTFPESVTPGLWAIELQVDGHPSGVHTFEIVAKPKPAPPPPVAPPTAADVYQQAVAASVFIDNQDSDGELLRQGSGFFIGKGLLLTAFQVIDGASSLQIDFPDGSRTTANQVLAWNRRQDWAILKVDAPKAPALERAKDGSWRVGDVCYLLGAPNESSRTIQNVGITGMQESAEAGGRLSTSWTGEPLSIGSPLLDNYGRVIGVLGGTLLPGIETLSRPDGREYILAGVAIENGATPLVVPISAIPEQLNSNQPVTLSALDAEGLFIRPVTRDTQVTNGVLCRNYRQLGHVAFTPEGQTSQFSRANDSLGVVITWTPNTKTKSTAQFQVYDIDNHLVGRTPLQKIDLEPRVTAYSAVKIALTSLKPGMYRIDLLLGDMPEWRGFFRVTE
jgi:hypothetical protein